MSPDDPRHGQYRGYRAHYKEDGGNPCRPCMDAAVVVRKRNRYRALIGHPATVSVIGARRRVQALQAIGHSHSAIARAAGVPTCTVRNVLLRESPTVYASTHAAIARAFDHLALVVPVGHGPTRVRNAAARLGYQPPFAWDDDTIDDPKAKPNRGRPSLSRSEVDEVLVQRILTADPADVRGLAAGTTKAEKHAVTTGWIASGRSQAELVRITGWNVSRYTPAPHRQENTAA